MSIVLHIHKTRRVIVLEDEWSEILVSHLLLVHSLEQSTNLADINVDRRLRLARCAGTRPSRRPVLRVVTPAFG